MRPAWAVTVALAAALLPGPVRAQQQLERRLAVSADVSIRIHNLGGTTRVSGWDRDTILVTGTAPAGTSFYFGGAGRLAKLGLEHPDGKYPIGGLLDVRVPRGARVWVKSAEGAIELGELSGEADLVSVAGTIRVQGTLRVLTVESMEGDVEIAGATPLVRVRTAGGRILLREPAGDLTASTVRGAIVVTGGRAESARLETVTGPVSYTGRIGARGTLQVQTHSGDIDLTLPVSLGAEFDLESLDGMVTVNLPTKSGKPPRGRTVYFAHAGGGANVVARSFKGQIRVQPE
jgi:hypothetical protein